MKEKRRVLKESKNLNFLMQFSRFLAIKIFKNYGGRVFYLLYSQSANGWWYNQCKLNGQEAQIFYQYLYSRFYACQNLPLVSALYQLLKIQKHICRSLLLEDRDRSGCKFFNKMLFSRKSVLTSFFHILPVGYRYWPGCEALWETLLWWWYTKEGMGTNK